MFELLAVPNTTANDGSYWWVWLLVSGIFIASAYWFYVDKIKKK